MATRVHCIKFSDYETVASQGLTGYAVIQTRTGDGRLTFQGDDPPVIGEFQPTMSGYYDAIDVMKRLLNHDQVAVYRVVEIYGPRGEYIL